MCKNFNFTAVLATATVTVSCASSSVRNKPPQTSEHCPWRLWLFCRSVFSTSHFVTIRNKIPTLSMSTPKGSTKIGKFVSISKTRKTWWIRFWLANWWRPAGPCSDTLPPRIRCKGNSWCMDRSNSCSYPTNQGSTHKKEKGKYKRNIQYPDINATRCQCKNDVSIVYNHVHVPWPHFSRIPTIDRPVGLFPRQQYDEEPLEEG